MNDITTDDILDFKNTIKDTMNFKNVKQPKYLSFNNKDWKQIVLALGVIFTLFKFMNTLSDGAKKIHDFLKYFKYIVQFMLPLLLILGCILFYLKLQKEYVVMPSTQEQTEQIIQELNTNIKKISTSQPYNLQTDVKGQPSEYIVDNNSLKLEKKVQ